MCMQGAGTGRQESLHILLGLVEHNSHHSANKLYLPLGHQMGTLHVTHSSKSWFSLKENRVFTVPGGV